MDNVTIFKESSSEARDITNIFKMKIFDGEYPMYVSLALVTIIIVVLSICVYYAVDKVKHDKAPKGLAFVAETYFNGVTNTYDEISNGKLQKASPYIFAIFTFLLLGNLMGLVGLEAVATAYTIPFIFAFVTWMGIFVIGIYFQKLRFFLRYVKNPIEFVGIFAPLISLSFRMFGNIIGGGTVLILFYQFAGWIVSLIPGYSDASGVVYLKYLFAPLISPFMHLYFDMFGAFIQTYVFTMLTTIFWSLEVETTSKKTKKLNKKTAVVDKANAAVY